MIAKLPVTLKLTIARINRKLKPEQKELRAARGDRMRQQAGDYYVLSRSKNQITDTHIDPETLARKIGALHDFEQVVT